VKIAFISDIHANLPALESVLKAITDCDAVICCGDVIGYYAEPNQVCELLRDLRILTIRGNHDAYVSGHLKPNPEHEQAYRIAWTRELLKTSHLKWLANLPNRLDLSFDDLQVTVRHANPWDEEQYLYPDSELIDQIPLKRQQVLVVGHTHRPMQRQVSQGLLVNPGSVGQPRDHNPGPSYAVLDVSERRFELMRTSYAVETYQEELQQNGWDQRVIEILSRSRLEATAL
jgi:putative phosphoesterase